MSVLSLHDFIVYIHRAVEISIKNIYYIYLSEFQTARLMRRYTARSNTLHVLYTFQLYDSERSSHISFIMMCVIFLLSANSFAAGLQRSSGSEFSLVGVLSLQHFLCTFIK